MIAMCRPLCCLIAVLSTLFFSSCQNADPVQVGFLGGLTGPVADLGTDGRNGVLLAFEEVNEKGGVAGRQVELLIRDDRQDPEVAKTAVRELLDRKVAAVIGPMTSNIAMAVVDKFNEAGVLLVSPTVTTDLLTGKNDAFLRVVADTSSYAHHMAEHVRLKSGFSRIAAVYETKNKAYAESWFLNFKKRFEQLGGSVARLESFASGPEARLSVIAESLAASRPDAVLIVASAMDAGMLAQHLRKASPGIRLLGSEWAATERIIELGGKSVEGMLLPQFFDRQSAEPRYIAFREAFQRRFGAPPGFPAVAGYDAARVVLAALAQKGKDEPLKDAILRIGRFEGAQTTVMLNSFGDASRRLFVVEVRNGQFAPVP